jgi:hypothetical protein
MKIQKLKNTKTEDSVRFMSEGFIHNKKDQRVNNVKNNENKVITDLKLNTN